MKMRMSREGSRDLLMSEELLLILPSSIVLAVVCGIAFAEGVSSIHREPQKIFLAASVLAVGCLWRLVRCFFRDGAAGLRSISRIWWAGAGLGAIIAIAAFISWLLPPSPKYTPWGEFRAEFNLLALGLPLLAPLVHLGCEAKCRRDSDQSGLRETAETVEPAPPPTVPPR
jgi:hypothetical protein